MPGSEGPACVWHLSCEAREAEKPGEPKGHVPTPGLEGGPGCLSLGQEAALGKVTPAVEQRAQRPLEGCFRVHCAPAGGPSLSHRPGPRAPVLILQLGDEVERALGGAGFGGEKESILIPYLPGAGSWPHPVPPWGQGALPTPFPTPPTGRELSQTLPLDWGVVPGSPRLRPDWEVSLEDLGRPVSSQPPGHHHLHLRLFHVSSCSEASFSIRRDPSPSSLSPTPLRAEQGPGAQRDCSGARGGVWGLKPPGDSSTHSPPAAARRLERGSKRGPA